MNQNFQDEPEVVQIKTLDDLPNFRIAVKQWGKKFLYSGWSKTIRVGKYL